MSRAVIIKGKLGYIYSMHKTRDRAEQALEDYMADGDISSYEFLAIQKHHERYCIILRGE